MPAKDIFTKQLWTNVAQDLKGPAQDWWTRHEKSIVGMAKDEMQDVFQALKSGDTVQAKLAIAARMTPDEWRAYRDGTTKRLSAIATRRAALITALTELATKVAKVVGKAAAGALGL